jgi:hypothetical protein
LKLAKNLAGDAFADIGVRDIQFQFLLRLGGLNQFNGLPVRFDANENPNLFGVR